MGKKTRLNEATVRRFMKLAELDRVVAEKFFNEQDEEEAPVEEPAAEEAPAEEPAAEEVPGEEEELPLEERIVNEVTRRVAQRLLKLKGAKNRRSTGKTRRRR